MGMNDLPEQPPIFPEEAEVYVQRAIDLSADAARRCDLIPDLPYGDDGFQRLDIYRPTRSDGTPLPVLIFAHGGAWTNGYKEWMGLLGPAVTELPAILVSISYRLAPTYRYPDPYEDCLAAVAWVHRHIAEYAGDPERIFVGGHSSGGTLFALVALRPEALEAKGLPRDVINGCLPISARFDLVLEDPEPGTTEARHKSMIFEPDTDMAAYSPLHHVATAQTPFLVAHGSADIPALCQQATEMVNRLRTEGIYVDHLVLEGHDHFDTALNIGDVANPWTQAMGTWLTAGPGGAACRPLTREGSHIHDR